MPRPAPVRVAPPPLAPAGCGPDTPPLELLEPDGATVTGAEVRTTLLPAVDKNRYGIGQTGKPEDLDDTGIAGTDQRTLDKRGTGDAAVDAFTVNP